MWTSVKLLRRLAWHEAGELAVMQDLARRFAALHPQADAPDAAHRGEGPR